MKKKSKPKSVVVSILNDEYVVHVHWCNASQILRIARRHFEDEEITKSWFEGVRGKTMKKKSYNSLIWIDLPITDKHFLSTVAHEAVHAVNFIWEDIGEEIKDEAYAHSVAAIVHAVEKKMR